MDLDSQPWFRGPTDSSPFSLFTLLNSRIPAFHCVACFPWTTQSSNVLWDGNMQQDLVSGWRDVAKEWMGAIAVGGTGRLCIFPKLATGKSTVLSVSDANAEITNVAWAISRKEPLKPLLVFTVSSVILIYDVTTREIVGKLRGHGGPITSLSVHPSSPELFCTTSRDFTARIYDLTLSPVQTPNNPRWFPNQGPSLAGPAHGLHMCEPEGEGIGRAVAVMVGGRSGGHAGAVLCSVGVIAFHPSHPLIATGGMDRAVKIWRIPPTVFASPPDLPILAREDKPLFSTDLIHKARILSIHWLADDILTSCSAPALMRHKPEDAKRTYWEDGSAIVWQWLGFNRFFPVGRVPQKVMRGTASDWHNSESLKILSGYHIPPAAKGFHVYQSLTHDPLLLIPLGKVIHIFNISRFSVRRPPKFPLDNSLVELTNRLSLGRSGNQSESSTPGPTAVDKQAENQSFSELEQHDNDTSSSGAAPPAREDEEEGDQEEERPEGDYGEQDLIPATAYPPPAPLAALFDSVENWEVVAELPQGGGPPVMPDITMCAMAFEGLGIVGIGHEGTLYAWRLKTEYLGRG